MGLFSLEEFLGTEVIELFLLVISFDLDVGEKLIIGNDDSTRIRIVPRDKLNTPTGLFDVLIFCDDKVLKNEIILRRKNKW